MHAAVPPRAWKGGRTLLLPPAGAEPGLEEERPRAKVGRITPHDDDGQGAIATLSCGDAASRSGSFTYTPAAANKAVFAVAELLWSRRGRHAPFWRHGMIKGGVKRMPAKKAQRRGVEIRKDLSPGQREELLGALKARFEKNMNRHQGLEWSRIQARLEANPEKLWSLNEMERTGGEPDVVGHDKQAGEYIFCDCSAESPQGRRSVCYDREALEARKEHKPKDSAVGMATDMGIEILSEEQYRELQTLGHFDTKTSSWVRTPPDIRKLGGAIFCDRRYGHVFTYHNGAESYYAARAFRGSLRV